MASTLLAIASNPLAMASNLRAMAKQRRHRHLSDSRKGTTARDARTWTHCTSNFVQNIIQSSLASMLHVAALHFVGLDPCPGVSCPWRCDSRTSQSLMPHRVFLGCCESQWCQCQVGDSVAGCSGRPFDIRPSRTKTSKLLSQLRMPRGDKREHIIAMASNFRVERKRKI